MTDNPMTLGRWLYERHGFKPNNYRATWSELSDGDQSRWEHYGVETHLAVMAGDFDPPRIPLVAAGSCGSCPGGCPEPACTCAHGYHGHGDRSVSQGLAGCFNCRCTQYTASVTHWDTRIRETDTP